MRKKDEQKRKREEKIKKDLGQHLKKLRTSRKLTLRQLAALADIDHASIDKSENGNRNTPVQDLYALAEAFDVDLIELFPYKKI
jgi:HTH-type transcriptional regulator, competence development regulator